MKLCGVVGKPPGPALGRVHARQSRPLESHQAFPSALSRSQGRARGTAAEGSVKSTRVSTISNARAPALPAQRDVKMQKLVKGHSVAPGKLPSFR